MTGPPVAITIIQVKPTPINKLNWEKSPDNRFYRRMGMNVLIPTAADLHKRFLPTFGTDLKEQYD